MLYEVCSRPPSTLALPLYHCSCRMLTMLTARPTPDHHAMLLAGQDTRQTRWPRPAPPRPAPAPCVAPPCCGT